MKTILFLICCTCVPSGAQSLFWDISLQIESAPNDWADRFQGKVFPGVIEVDSSRITGAADETLRFDGSNPAFSLALTFNDETYTAYDDPAFGLPALYFSAGELKDLDYAVYLSDPAYGEGSFFQLYPDGLMSYSPDGVGEYEGNYRITSSSVPEPSVAALLLPLILTSITRRNR